MTTTQEKELREEIQESITDWFDAQFQTRKIFEVVLKELLEYAARETWESEGPDGIIRLNRIANEQIEKQLDVFLHQ